MELLFFIGITFIKPDKKTCYTLQAEIEKCLTVHVHSMIQYIMYEQMSTQTVNMFFYLLNDSIAKNIFWLKLKRSVHWRERIPNYVKQKWVLLEYIKKIQFRTLVVVIVALLSKYYSKTQF